LTDPQLDLATTIALSQTPKSLTWLAFQVQAPPSRVARSVRRLVQTGQAEWIPGRGFRARSEEEGLGLALLGQRR
jgi:hypothetical protein